MENILEPIYQLGRWIHIFAGALGLFLFWVPVTLRKGSNWHKKTGRWFIWCSNTVAYTAISILSLRLFQVWESGRDPSTLKQWPFIVMLFYLAIILLVSGWYTRHALLSKTDITRLRRPLARGLAVLTSVASLVVMFYAWRDSTGMTALLWGLSPLGFLTTWGMYKHLSRPEREPKSWIIEHLGTALGMGIAFHTAFFVLGMRSFTEAWLTGFWGVIPWILPTLLGIPLISWMEKRYRRRFMVANQERGSTLFNSVDPMEPQRDFVRP